MTLYIPAPNALNSPGTSTPLDTADPLALDPPRFAGAIENVVDADFALGIDQLKDGALCAIDPWVNMEVGDFLELFVTDQNRADAYKFIGVADKNQRILLTIPRSYFSSKTYENVHYRITRFSGTAENSPPQKTLVLLTRPGGVDQNSDPISHSELHQQLEADVAERGIDAERAKAGTWVTIVPYTYLRVRDRIELKWGTESIRHVVTQEQAESPASNPIKIFVSRTVIENAGSATKLPVMFQPIDEANNRPDENGPWSTPSYVDVDLDDSKLAEPYIEDADYVTGEIDLKALNGRDVRVEVQTNRQNYAPGDIIHLTWAGETVEGTPVRQTFDIPVSAPGRTYEAFVFYDNVKAIPYGKAVVSYEVQTGNGRLYSRKTIVRIIGKLNALIPPSIDKANGEYLPENLDQAMATIPIYPGRQSNDLVILFIKAVRPGGGTELYEDARLVGDLPPGMPITRLIQGRDLDRFAGLRVTVTYEVHTSGVQISDPLHLTVGEPRKDLPAPILEGATDDDVFDPVPDREVIYQIPLILTTTKDQGNWYFQGFSREGSTRGTFELTPGSAARPIRIPLSRHFVDLNLDRTVKLFYNLRRNGVEMYSEYREVRIGSPLPSLLEPSVVEAPNGLLDPNRYQNGFTARVITSAFKPDDAIELAVLGRPGDGSTVPERKIVNGQAYVDFSIPAGITGANLKQIVKVSYKVIRTGQETPSRALDLSIGDLLQQNMPAPLIEGFTGAELKIGAIKDDTKVLCDKWPFQRSGLPVWLSYVESRTDGTSRTRDQFVGATHDQGAGLSYTTEVQWLRECRADSKVAIVLKVGLFREAAVSDAVECQSRVYSVQAGLDDLTTFNGFDWNGWSLVSGFRSQIGLLAGEYFAESIIDSMTSYAYVYLQKTFQLDIGEQYSFSFDYQSPTAANFYLALEDKKVFSGTIPASSAWQSRAFNFYSGTTPAAPPVVLKFHFGGSRYNVRMDNLRLRRI
jgi:hypothetical protein